MEKKNTMENKTNIMGSEVVDGYECKPKVLDPNKPIMHYKTLIYICEDQRCKAANKDQDKAKQLRQILKQINLETGKNRIKISRSLCQGACRYRQVVQINENTKANGYEANNGIWLKHTHKYDIDKWKDLFLALKENKNIEDIKKFDKIEMKVF
jgi:cobalt-precorrin 5A hydrolase